MLTLAEIAQKFAVLDALPADRMPALEKALRNLVQRHYLPPSDQKGRVFFYSDRATASIRIAFFASEFGLDRALLERLLFWMQTGRDHNRGTLIDEAFARVSSGERFHFYVVMSRDGEVRCEADWSREPGKVTEALADYFSSKGEIGRFSIPVSEIISEIVGA